MRSTKYDRATLEPIVKTSRTLADVMRKLNLKPSGGNYRYISLRIRNAEIDTSHLRGESIASRVRALTVERLAALVADSTSVRQVTSKLGFSPDGRASHELKRRIVELEVDTTHFKGRGWSRGDTKLNNPILREWSSKFRLPNETVFVENSRLYQGAHLVPRLLEMGWSYECAWCQLTEWRGIRLVLHLDHINGVHNDNRLENLRLLCPNCHTQTSTYSNRRPK